MYRWYKTVSGYIIVCISDKQEGEKKKKIKRSIEDIGKTVKGMLIKNGICLLLTTFNDLLFYFFEISNRLLTFLLYIAAEFKVCRTYFHSEKRTDVVLTLHSYFLHILFFLHM